MDKGTRRSDIKRSVESPILIAAIRQRSENMHQEYMDLSEAKARLHLSEMPFTLPQKIQEAILEEVQNANIYPEPGSVTATNALAKHWGIAAENLVIANGCDEVILTTFLKFGLPGNVVLSSNSYTGYREIAALAGQNLKEVSLRKWRQDTDNIVGAFDDKTKLAIICNPHNPTGSLLSKKALDAFIAKCNQRKVVPVIDEAYIDFATAGRSLVKRINDYENLIIWRSFAKSHGLAGIRLGAAVGSKHLMTKLKEAAESIPFSVNRISQRLVLEITKNEQPFCECRNRVMSTRAAAQKALKELGVWHTQSQANFLFLKAPDGIDASKFYKRSGVLVRDCVGYGLPGYWRVACGSDKEMSLFLGALKKTLSDLSPHDVRDDKARRKTRGSILTKEAS